MSTTIGIDKFNFYGIIFNHGGEEVKKIGKIITINKTPFRIVPLALIVAAIGELRSYTSWFTGDVTVWCGNDEIVEVGIKIQTERKNVPKLLEIFGDTQ